MMVDDELEDKKSNLSSNDELVVTYRKKSRDKKPPFIVVGNGFATKKFPENVSQDAFKIFNDLSKAQRELFIDFKDLLVQQQMESHYGRKEVENPNLIRVENDKDNDLHNSIRDRMSKNRNGAMLEEKGVLKKIKNGRYMLNPYIFIPANNFEEVAQIWDDLKSA
jgi:hypothetical protein